MTLSMTRFLRNPWLQGGLIALVTLLAYLPALENGFVWDDDDYVTRNETLAEASGLRRIWLERGSVPQYYWQVPHDLIA